MAALRAKVRIGYTPDGKPISKNVSGDTPEALEDAKQALLLTAVSFFPHLWYFFRFHVSGGFFCSCPLLCVRLCPVHRLTVKKRHG